MSSDEEEVDRSGRAEITAIAAMSWSSVLMGCAGLCGLGSGLGSWIGWVVLGAGVAFGSALTAGVWLRLSGVVMVLSGIWAAISGLAALVSPAIAIWMVDLLSPASARGFQWSGPGEAFAGVVATLLFLGLQLAGAAGLYSWASGIRKLPARNLCPNCGYDLRATASAWGPLLDQCPECGWRR